MKDGVFNKYVESKKQHDPHLQSLQIAAMPARNKH